MILVATYETDSLDVIFDESVKPDKTVFSSGNKGSVAAQHGLAALTAVVGLLQVQPILATNVAPLTILHQDIKTSDANTRYKGPTPEIDMAELQFLLTERLILETLSSESVISGLEPSSQEIVRPLLDRWQAPEEVRAARVQVDGALQSHPGDSASIVAKFLKSVQVDDDITDDPETMSDLEDFLHVFGPSFVEALGQHLNTSSARPSIVATVLVLLGQVEHPATQTHRLNIMLDMLTSPKVRIRDGAVAGLGYIMSKEAIPALDEAADKESNPYVRYDMENLLRLLMEM